MIHWVKVFRRTHSSPSSVMLFGFQSLSLFLHRVSRRIFAQFRCQNIEKLLWKRNNACVCVPRTVAVGHFVNKRVCIASICLGTHGKLEKQRLFTAANNRKSPTASVDLYIFEYGNLHFNLEMKRCRASCEWNDELKYVKLGCWVPLPNYEKNAVRKKKVLIL